MSADAVTVTPTSPVPFSSGTMAADRAFDRALYFVLLREGVEFNSAGKVIDRGFVDNPADPGGRTAYGITQDTYWAYCASVPKDRADVADVSFQEVISIYRSRYWRDGKCDLFAEAKPLLALCHFDWGVNGGISRALRYLQAAVGATVDGVWGPATLAAILACDEAAAVATYLRLRTAHYHARADIDTDAELARLNAAGLWKVVPKPNATQKVWLNGWLARVRWVARACGVAIDPSFAKPS